MLAENYISIAEELDDLLIPAGVVFMRCAGPYPEVELWDEDGQHPSPEGTYLAACATFAVSFQESPEGCPYTAKLQGIAADLVLV